MALNSDQLAQEILDSLILMLQSNPNINFYPTQEVLIVWKAVAIAIIEHIKTNAQLTLSGNEMEHGQWKIT